jgi:hypothetical protein
MGVRVSWSWLTLTSLLVTGVGCGGKSSDEPGGGQATSTGGSSNTGGQQSGGRNAEGGRSAGGGRTATGGSAAGGTRAEGGQVAAGGRIATAGAHPLTLEGLFQAQCDAAVSCCSKKQLGAQPSRCAGEFGWAVTERKLENGELVLDPDALEDCIAAYENAATTCTETGLFAACRAVFSGTKPPGDPCSDFQDCDRREGPVICKFVGNDPTGTCTPLIHGEEGQLCDYDCQNRVDCSGNEGGLSTVPRVYCFEDEGLYCSAAGDGALACRKLRAIGEECENGSACGSEGRCKQTSSSVVSRSCVLGLELGQTCQTIDRAACAEGLWCDGPSETGVCREYEFYKAAVCQQG